MGHQLLDTISVNYWTINAVYCWTLWVSSNTILLAQVPEDGLFLRGGRILPKRPHAAVGIAANEVVGIEFDDRRRDHVKEFLHAYVILPRCGGRTDFFGHMVSSP